MRKNLRETTIHKIDLALCATQLVCSLLVLVFVASSLELQTFEYKQTGSLRQSVATPTTTFVLLLAYSSLLYAIWYLTCVVMTRFVPRPMRKTEFAVNLVFTAAYLIGSLALTCHPYYYDCDMFDALEQPPVDCDNLSASMHFCWLTSVVFGVCAAWHGLMRTDDLHVPKASTASIDHPMKQPLATPSAY